MDLIKQSDALNAAGDLLPVTGCQLMAMSGMPFAHTQVKKFTNSLETVLKLNNREGAPRVNE